MNKFVGYVSLLMTVFTLAPLALATTGPTEWDPETFGKRELEVYCKKECGSAALLCVDYCVRHYEGWHRAAKLEESRDRCKADLTNVEAQLSKINSNTLTNKQLQAIKAVVGTIRKNYGASEDGAPVK